MSRRNTSFAALVSPRPGSTPDSEGDVPTGPPDIARNGEREVVDVAAVAVPGVARRVDTYARWVNADPLLASATRPTTASERNAHTSAGRLLEFLPMRPDRIGATRPYDVGERHGDPRKSGGLRRRLAWSGDDAPG